MLSRIANKGTSAVKKYVPGKSIKEVQGELVSLINLIKPPFDVSILAEQAAIEALRVVL